MSRRRSLEDSSLELLLDTICNTFGGILFLAMLVSLLLTQTQRRTAAKAAAAGPQPALSPAEITRMERRIENLQHEAERIESLLEDVANLSVQFASPENESLARALAAAESRNATLQARQAELLATAADAQAASARAAATAKEEERRFDRARADLDAARRRLADAQRESSALVKAAATLEARLQAAETVETTGRAPRERVTSKREFGLLLKYGRVYHMHRYTPNGRSVNLTDFFVVEGSEFNRAHPRPTAGIDLAAPAAFDQVEASCRPFPADEWHPSLVVHGDSFAEFLILKSWLVKRNYEYRVIPTAEGVVDQGADSGEVRVQ
jgi:hypothetical protein